MSGAIITSDSSSVSLPVWIGDKVGIMDAYSMGMDTFYVTSISVCENAGGRQKELVLITAENDTTEYSLLLSEYNKEWFLINE